MKLVALHEAKYAHGRTLQKIMSFVEDGRIRQGFEMRINDNPIELIGYYDPTNPDDPMYDPDNDDQVPYFVATLYGQEDPEVLHEEDFLPYVEVWEMKRII